VFCILATGQWFSPDTPVSSTNKTDRQDIAEILSKVALNTIKQTNKHIIHNLPLLYFPTFPSCGLCMFNATISKYRITCGIEKIKCNTLCLMFLCIKIYDSIDLGFTRGEHANHCTTDAVFNDMKHVLYIIYLFCIFQLSPVAGYACLMPLSSTSR
jgi:hypothetical protein